MDPLGALRARRNQADVKRSRAALADAGHTHFSAGVPGNPKKPARVIEVTMKEGEGTMSYEPARIEVKRGEQIRFVLNIAGELAHEFVLASTADNLASSAQQMTAWWRIFTAGAEPSGFRLATWTSTSP